MGMLLKIVDSTLRDGEQEIDISFSRKEKEEILAGILKTGITHFEAGIPASGDREFISSLRGEKITAICWCRAVETDIEAALSCGTGALHIGFPVSPLLLDYTGWNRQRLITMTGELITRVKKECDYLSVGAMDCFRAEPDLLYEFVEEALDSGADSVRMADTPGIALPREVRSVFERFPGKACKLEFHGHNDLGLAVANSLEAVECGAGGISGTFYGIGERAGNTPLEEILMALNLKHGRRLPKSLDLAAAAETACKVAEILGEPVSPRKPVCGSNVFRHESGIHVKGMLKNPGTFQPYPPELVGKTSELLLGSSTGRHAVFTALQNEGITVAQTELLPLVESIRSRSIREKRSFQFSEIRNFLS